MDVEAPPPRDYGQETRDTLQAQVDLAPDRYAAEAEFSPQYVSLNTANLRRALLGANGQPGMVDTLREVSPELTALQSETNTAARTADVNDVATLGPKAREAFRATNPDQAALMDLLNEQARQELESGTSLTPGMAGQLSQQVRAAQASRGLGFGQPDALVEAYTLGDRGLNLQQQRQMFAQRVAGLNQATSVDPALTILGRPSQSVAAGQAMLGQGAGALPGWLFNPESGYAQDVYNTNFNSQAAANIAKANNNAALYGSAISAAGSIGSSF